ncbi:hypothetical protein L0Y69_03455 [bacterium]|nr:hypothetical protein [bacterium]
MASSRPAQEFIPFKEIRDGIVVLRDGSFRAILMTSSLNVALKSQEEQGAIVGQFQNFLNSLEFMIQFSVESRRLDIRPYIALLEDREKEQVNELMKIQTREYINFIKNFTETTNIMSKTFFVVVPYSPTVAAGIHQKGILGFGGTEGRSGEKAKEWLEEFEEAKTQIEQRVAVVEQGLSRVGIRLVQLGTEELIELFYKIFNPGELEKPVQLEQLK